MSSEDSAPDAFDDDHARLREQLGAYALGHLERDDVGATTALRAHLDGCASCRADLVEITPLVRLLGEVEPAAFGSPPFPPPELGSRIRDAVARERAGDGVPAAVGDSGRHPVAGGPGPDQVGDQRGRRRASSPRRRRSATAAAAAAVVAAALGAGAWGGRATAPDPPAAAPVPIQPVALRATDGAMIDVSSAGIVAHTWGVELRMQGSGFARGEVFSAAVRGAAGRMQPAGRFLGTGQQMMTCNLQSAVPADEARAIVIKDDQGRTVLRASL